MSQQIDINVLKSHPRNNEFFDDLNGEEFERLKNSIKDEKIYNDILVSPDMTIISGHQRVRAAKELGMKLVPIKIDEDLQDENSKLRALISNNFGRRKNDPEKDRKALVTYVELKGYRNGEIGRNHFQQCHNGIPEKLTLDEIAQELNISKRNLQRALSIERNLTDAMKELLDDGVVSKTLASDVITSLSEKEQEELISKLDATKKYTQKQVKKYIDEIKQLKSQKQEVKIVENTDYSLENKINELQQQINRLQKEKSDIELLNRTLKSSKESTENLLNSYKKESEEYIKLKNNVASLNLQPDGNYNVLDLLKETSTLSEELETLLTTKLSPLRYSKILPVVKSNNALRKNMENIIYMVDDWCKSMANAIGVTTNENIIDMEELN